MAETPPINITIDQGNTYVNSGRRFCRKCSVIKQTAYVARKKEKESRRP